MVLRTFAALLLVVLLISSATTLAFSFDDDSRSNSNPSTTSAAAISTSMRRRPRQFRMDIYSRPNHKGTVQHVGTSNGASTPCWNLQSKHIGSFDVNDPMVKISFYRSADCLGAPSQVFRGSLDQRKHSNVQLRARSVSIKKLRPILLSETISTSKTTVSSHHL
ncbi:hypothetical protein BDB00DRAFT_800272 [Zychaea mexicana]|uniref:uncharacterized protein n=1 Tax=Zychaea mexicana TaxID=64656 RepID=UPI0022FE9E07|nr:uncharacterized protein BDB00DRAFT_800272 [Zychaea mexicana]KAI9498428.1 hypothetical protein BDB00DRAFT_800272 [Zychaea mexicana]